MKILFVTPPMGNWAPWGERHLAANMLYTQLAAFIRSKGAGEVGVIDSRALKLSDDGMMEQIRAQKPDVVFFGSLIPAAGGAAQLDRFNAAMKKVKEALPHIWTVAGGLMYTAIPKQIMEENPAIDFVIVGDCEYTLKELLENIGKSSASYQDIKGLVYRDGDEIVVNPRRGLIADLNELPMPAYDLFPMHAYYG
jgi:radical SAM superfamily enzyme YgiQ (UPF0313 family)